MATALQQKWAAIELSGMSAQSSEQVETGVQRIEGLGDARGQVLGGVRLRGGQTRGPACGGRTHHAP